jgi:endonuclease YncB( thermonuclease family)
MSQIDLSSFKSKDLPIYSFKGYVTPMKFVQCYDGDTATAIMVPPNSSVPIKINCRIEGIDTPEMKPLLSCPNRDELKARAVAARNRLCELLTGQAWSDPCDEHSMVVEVTCGGFDKYGRLLVRIGNVSETMISEGLANPYGGGTKAAFNV